MKITPTTRIRVMTEAAADITTDAINRNVDIPFLDAVVELFRASLYFRNGKVNYGDYQQAIDTFGELQL